MLLSSDPSHTQGIPDCGGEGEEVVSHNRHISILYCGVVEMPVEVLLDVRNRFLFGDATGGDVLSSLHPVRMMLFHQLVMLQFFLGSFMFPFITKAFLAGLLIHHPEVYISEARHGGEEVVYTTVAT